ncbi:Grc3 protein homologue, putative [Candida dubliniensis CD36]|uniref:Polynucleotide 5'-hydroxyl-kinase GRC3 n=1 Tax=Candida dubliniensis (strain CD36 / ATCC MYA-646 / CBS 7987 / NCPF 3949 / NRRL Y-17841) TaxID=573826 RepID=B9WM51_CANDC|nr:Grc3 protein homologue, putative [Candida dubliniensis CD36]CAX40164.1 Grc3 protein homologue, putative [Candida dubliniensis CD36]
MSAFAALKNNPFGESIFNTNDNNSKNTSQDEDDEDDEEVVQYVANTSDEGEEDDDDDNDEEQVGNNFLPFEISAPDDTSLSSTPAPIVNFRITQSNFAPNETNIKFSNNHVIIILNPSEYILISGQCNLKVIEGAIKINQCHYLTSGNNKSYNIIALQSQSLPIISHYTPEEGQPSSASIIQLENSFSGIENISQIDPAFKNLIFGQANFETSLFKNYSFDIVLTETSENSGGGYGFDINSYWINELNLLKSNNDPTPKIIMIIGNKNTGKSTFCKSLINELLLANNNRPISYLEIDPGQSEYSTPYALSLSEIVDVQFGLVALPQNTNIVKSCVEHYYGFTSAVNAPTRYVKIIEKLFDHYQTKFGQRNHLIINTPGWVKGYGKELLNQITKIINPNKLILLSNNLNQQYPDNINILQDLTYQSLSILPGIYQLSKYSAPQIRNINKLLYFHQNNSTSKLRFNFNNHLLDFSPLKISYACFNSPNNPGIYSTTILNHNIDNEFSHRDLCSLIEVSIYGIYAIKYNKDSNLDDDISVCGKDGNSPFYLNPDDFNNLLSNNNDKTIISSKFIGLIMVHSINNIQHYMNIYAPDKVINRLQKIISKNQPSNYNYKLMMVKGEGDIPNCEILYPNFINKKIEYLKSIKKKKKKSIDTGEKIDLKLPYISFETKSKIGGIWKVRKNIKRRGHRQGN